MHAKETKTVLVINCKRKCRECDFIGGYKDKCKYVYLT